ncbi:hypothetical protein O6H91_07G011300 [Diphasiastrum complanatum]|uniref:Uncharacterized protein n=1 Tax=Diphasiastrum complanatum TaxID=34168 RepID=A0ACC2D2H8_DIPCM|nr:hypothetical protein O6H91_07G011300 [Diphasiastrum complanatum]
MIRSFASRPKSLAGTILSYNHTDVVFAEYGPYWRDTRKMCQLQFFTPKRMEASKHIRIEEAYLMLKSIRHECEGGGAVDIHSHVYGLTRSIMARMVLKKKYFASDSKEAINFEEIVTEHEHLLGVINLGDFIPYIGWLDIQGYKRQMKALRKRLDSFLDRIIREHLDKKLDVSTDASLDFIDVLLSTGSINDHYEHLSVDNIKAVVFVSLKLSIHSRACCRYYCSDLESIFSSCFGHAEYVGSGH